MKVLMFGWEFPPNISGGLGIACFGLTKSLVKEKTQVLFVVPKARGDESTSATIISASDIDVPTNNKRKEGDAVFHVESKSQNVLVEGPSIKTLMVSSSLSPYTSLSPLEDNGTQNENEKTSFHSLSAPKQPIQSEEGVIRYSFSGKYGQNLSEEVVRYAEVAEEIAKQNSFDVIHAHDWLTYPAGIAAKKVSGKALVVHVHATEYDRAGKNMDPRIYQIEREGMEQADWVIAVSHWTKEILVSRYGIKADKITVVHNGVISSDESRPMHVSHFGKKLVTFLGRITYQKGPEYFIDAAAKVLEKFPDVRFAMAGTGDLLSKMVERAAQLRISSHFHFTGFLNGPEVERMWAMSDVYVMPSVSEPFGIASLEAIQAGVPVIISNQSGVGEVMPHAIKIDYWDVDELANAIITVLNYKSMTKTLKEKSKQSAKQITWRKAAKKVNAIYHKLQPKPEHPQFINLYFQVHQPRRLGKFGFFDIGSGSDYFDDGLNQQIMQRVAANCYLPTNLLLLKLIDKYPQIRVTFSISGTALRQFQRFAPDVVESFRMLAATGAVEFLGETYYHSLACMVSPEEFDQQVRRHSEKINELFGVRPTVFRNTELIYSDEIGQSIGAMGFKGIFTDGIDHILGERSQHHLYLHPDKDIKLFLRNYRLSDDISFRFLQGNNQLTAEKYIDWLEQIPKEQKLITMGMDYETFGEHQKANTGIFNFFEEFLSVIAVHKHFKMITPSDAIEIIEPADILTVPGYISWADQERDLSAWLGNDMQQDAFKTLCKMEESIKNTESLGLLNTWRYLQTSDHFYYMSTKTGDDDNVHNYFSPYNSPYEAFMNYMNVLSDLFLQVEKLKDTNVEHKHHFDITLEHAAKNGIKWRPETLTF